MTSTESHDNAHVAMQKHARKQRLLVLVLVCLIVLLAASVASVFLLNRSSKEKAQASLSDAITVRSEEQGKITVKSQLGVTASYDSEFIDAHAQVTTTAKDGYIGGIGYEGKDLATPRSYSIIKFEVKTDAADADEFAAVLSRPGLTVLTTAREAYFPSRRPNYPGLNDTEIAVREFAPETAELKTREQEVINGVTYEKLLYEYKGSYGSTISYQLQHITVQNERPYVAELYYYPTTKDGDMTSLSQILDSLTYAIPDKNAQYLTGVGDEPTAMGVVAGTSIILGAAKTVNAPKTLKDGTDLSVVAKNQLAVVRVGSIYCYQFSLLNIDGSTGLDDKSACGAGSGSGAIMNTDGMVSTNGHVVLLPLREAIETSIQLYVRVKDYTPVQQYLDYFVNAGLLSSSESTALMQDIQAAKAEAFESVNSLLEDLPDSQIKVSKKAGEYAIQLSNTPIKLKIDDQKLTFNYGKTIVKAKYIDSDFDEKSKDFRYSSNSDVALLDIETTKSFPIVVVGKMSNLRVGSDLTAMGFPSFVDGGITTTKRKTVPSATQGKVLGSFYDLAGHLVISTKVPVAQGNSGGPTFDKNGKQIGLVTYAANSAVDAGLGKTKFSRESFIRDIADFTELADVHSVTFTGKSELNDKWYAAVSAFADADYGKARDLLKDVRAEYGEHYLVASLIDASDEQLGSSFQQLVRVGVVVAVFLLAAGVVACVVILVRLRVHKPTMLTYSGMPPQMPAPQF